MLERRRSQRELALKTAIVLANGHPLGITCTIRNWAADGACLQLPNGLRLPASCELALEGSHDAIRAYVVWRSSSRVGVTFNDRSPSPTLSPQVA